MDQLFTSNDLEMLDNLPVISPTLLSQIPYPAAWQQLVTDATDPNGHNGTDHTITQDYIANPAIFGHGTFEVETPFGAIANTISAIGTNSTEYTAPEYTVPGLMTLASQYHYAEKQVQQQASLHGITLPPPTVCHEPMEGFSKDMKPDVNAPFVSSYNTKTFTNGAPKTNDIAMGNETMTAVNLSVFLMEKGIGAINTKAICSMFGNRACLGCVSKEYLKRGDVVKGQMYCHTCLKSADVPKAATLEGQFQQWVSQPFSSWCYNIKEA